MDIYLKAVAGVMISVILWLCISKDNKSISVLLSIAVCIVVITISFTIFNPVIEFINKLKTLGGLNQELIAVILKAVGIGMLAELTSIICKDAGNEAMGKSLQFLSTVLILWLSIPVFETLISLLDDILGAI